MSDQHIAAAPDIRKYRTELPNLYDDMGLDVYEFRLLAHYVRRGSCWESTRTTAEHCQISVGKVSSTRQSLQEKGLIRITENDHGTMTITVVDIWDENFAQYAQRSPHEHQRSPHEHQRSPHEHQRSPHEPKNKPYKNKPSKKDISSVHHMNTTLSQQPLAYTERQQALKEFDRLGGVTSYNASLVLNDVLDQLEEKNCLSWAKLAVEVSIANQAYSVQYAIQVLRNAIRSGHAPGQRPTANGGGNRNGGTYENGISAFSGRADRAGNVYSDGIAEINADPAWAEWLSEHPEYRLPAV